MSKTKPGKVCPNPWIGENTFNISANKSISNLKVNNTATAIDVKIGIIF